MKKNLFPILLLFVLAIIAFYLYFNSGSGTLRKELSNFAVNDTSSIVKIFLADKTNKTVLLERNGMGPWTVNKKYRVREDILSTLLLTVKRMTVKSPISKAAFDNIVKQLAVNSVKVEIYQGADEPSKVFYVGGPDPDHSGSYMLLENSTVPFLVHIEGFHGFLSTRFSTNENDWRSNAIFRFGYGEISTVRVEHIQDPSRSFEITEHEKNKYSLRALHPEKEATFFDTAAILNYVDYFRNINFESFEETKTDAYKDSILKSTPKDSYAVTGKDGIIKTIKTFLKPAQDGAKDTDGKPIIYDLDRMYGLLNNQDFVVIQYFVFDPLDKSFFDFQRQETSNQ